MTEKIQERNAHDMCISACSFFNMSSGGCRNNELFPASTPGEIAEARELMAADKGCRNANHLGDLGSMVFDEQVQQWLFVPDESGK